MPIYGNTGPGTGGGSVGGSVSGSGFLESAAASRQVSGSQSDTVAEASPVSPVSNSSNNTTPAAAQTDLNQFFPSSQGDTEHLIPATKQESQQSKPKCSGEKAVF